jgi:hypothetical protein
MSQQPDRADNAEIPGNYEYHLIEEKLFITSQPPGEQQIVLGTQAAYDLLEYLYQHRDELYQAIHRSAPTGSVNSLWL